jgi:hypothetical protein
MNRNSGSERAAAGRRRWEGARRKLQTGCEQCNRAGSFVRLRDCINATEFSVSAHGGSTSVRLEPRSSSL